MLYRLFFCVTKCTFYSSIFSSFVHCFVFYMAQMQVVNLYENLEVSEHDTENGHSK